MRLMSALNVIFGPILAGVGVYLLITGPGSGGTWARVALIDLGGIVALGLLALLSGFAVLRRWGGSRALALLTGIVGVAALGLKVNQSIQGGDSVQMSALFGVLAAYWLAYAALVVFRPDRSRAR